MTNFIVLLIRLKEFMQQRMSKLKFLLSSDVNNIMNDSLIMRLSTEVKYLNIYVNI